ncbi:hypothetical protein NKG94_17585 [Micromonospora sp. M12]
MSQDIAVSLFLLEDGPGNADNHARLLIHRTMRTDEGGRLDEFWISERVDPMRIASVGAGDEDDDTGDWHGLLLGLDLPAVTFRPRRSRSCSPAASVSGSKVPVPSRCCEPRRGSTTAALCSTPPVPTCGSPATNRSWWASSRPSAEPSAASTSPARAPRK